MCEARPRPRFAGGRTEFSYDRIRHGETEKNMRLSAERVLPVLQRDGAIATPPTPVKVFKDEN
jgi:hypothetical protein